MATPIPEKKVLKPRDPAITNENDWPEFSLKNVRVANDEGLPARLLSAGEDNPLTVTGNLDAVTGRARKSLLPNVPHKGQSIELSNVFRYSYGAYADGEIQLWAEGAAGWFAIKPAESYRHTFSEMIEAVGIWYFALDTYKERKKTTADELVEKYASSNELEPETARAMLYKHKDFLIEQMLKKEEGVKWGLTSLFKLLRRVSQEVPGEGRSQQSQETVKRSALSALPEAVSEPSRKKSQNQPARQQTVPEPVSGREYDKTRVNALWRFIQKSAEDGAIRNPDDLNLQAFARLVHTHFVFATENEAANYIRFSATDLVGKMEHRDSTRTPWTASAIYSELLAAKLAPIVRVKIAKLSLQRRSSPFGGDQGDEPEDAGEHTESSEDHAVASHARAGKRHHTRGGLRMTTGKAPGKGNGRGKHRTIVLDEDDEGSVVSTGSKRRVAAGEDHPRKRSRRLLDPTDDDRDEEGNQSESDTGAGAQESKLKLPSRIRTSDSPDSSNLSDLEDFDIEAGLDADPDGDQTEPGDVWSCDHMGCNHTVYGASHMLGRALVQEHIDEHNETIRYVLGEKGLTNLPVGNLIKRIRQIADTQVAFPFGAAETNQAFPLAVANAV